MMDERVDRMVEAYVDDLLDVEARREMDAMVTANPDLRDAVEVARQVKEALRAMETPLCPPEVSVTILEQVRREEKSPTAVRQRKAFHLHRWAHPRLWQRVLAFLSRLPRTEPLGWRPAFGAAILIAAVAVLTRPWQSAPTPAYSSTEVQQALAEVKWTLSYLNDVGSRTGGAIRDEVLAERVVDPMRRGLGLSTSDENGADASRDN